MSCFKLPDTAEPNPEQNFSEERVKRARHNLRHNNGGRIQVGDYRNFLGVHLQATFNPKYPSQPDLSEPISHLSCSAPGQVWLPLHPVCFNGGKYYTQDAAGSTSRDWPTADPYEFIPVFLFDCGIEDLGYVTIPPMKDFEEEYVHILPHEGRTFRAFQTRRHWTARFTDVTGQVRVGYEVSHENIGYVLYDEVWLMGPRGWLWYPPKAFSYGNFANNAPPAPGPSGLSPSEAIVVE